MGKYLAVKESLHLHVFGVHWLFLVGIHTDNQKSASVKIALPQANLFKQRLYYGRFLWRHTILYRLVLVVRQFDTQALE